MIIKLTQKQAREHGISKSTLHYLRKNAKNGKSFRVYEKIPNQGMLKGIIFGLTIYLITSFRVGIEFLACGYDIAYSSLWITGTFILFFTFGIVLGYLYKPTK